MISWKLVKKKVSDLKEHPKNPRILKKDQAEHLKESLDKFGLIDKPIINSDNMIIGGHQRLNIIAYTEVECWMPDRMLTMDEVDELNIRLNKNTGDWDYDLLANEWNEQDLYEWGFKPEELSVGPIIVEDEKTEEKEDQKPLKMCPQCGHEF